MKILLLGKNGQVGWELNRTLLPLGDIIALDVEELDLTRPKDIREKVRYIQPDIIVNGAAYTAVDRAEKEQELAMKINGIAPGILAEEAKKCGALLVHYSTDYIFDGTKEEPYTENDKPNPINFYGTSKLAGELAIQKIDHPYLIFRTSWVYGLRGNNFLLTMMRLAREQNEIRVVNDQIGSPTWSRLIAEVTHCIVIKVYCLVNKGVTTLDQLSGIYHLTSSNCCSWYDFAVAIIDKLKKNDQNIAKVVPILSCEYPVLAKRPINSRLDTGLLAKQFDVKFHDWKKVLDLIIN